MTSVVVVGGGMTGLAAAHALMTSPHEVDITLLEKEPRLGGKILTEEHDGLLYEAGPDAFVARDPSILKLCNDLGLGDDLIPPAVFGAYIWSGGKLQALPRDWAFGLPGSISSLFANNALSIETKLRALWDLVAPGKLTGDDIAVGTLVRRRLGSQVLEGVVDPLLAGSRAGTADDISLAAGMPQLDLIARSSASLMRGLGAARRDGKLASGPPPFLGITGGMQRLVQRLAESLSGASVRVGCAATGVEPEASGGYRVRLDDGSSVTAQGVILAAPAYVSAQLVEALDPDTARQLYRISYASSAVAVLVYLGGQYRIPGGSGFLVPSGDRKLLSACTWFSEKWPQVAPGDPRLVIRAFVGRAGRDASLNLNDDDLLSRIDAEVRQALGLTEELAAWKLYRWEQGLPHYGVGHLGVVESIEQALAAHPGIALAGAGYRGSGLPDCVRQGQEAAGRVLATVSPTHG